MLLLYLNRQKSKLQVIIPLHSTMLLLYLATAPCEPYSDTVFTFHYASTISKDAATLRPAHSPLHSTMLLLYLTYWRHAENVGNYFTFHYASTISVMPGCTVMPRCTLHSTMLLLYQTRMAASIANELTLHSTMLLLYPILDPEYWKRDKLYIPLCFYYIT